MGSVLWIPVIFTISATALYYLSVCHPSLESTHLNSSALKFPSNINELHALADLLNHYRSDHFWYVLLLFSSAYLLKQTFAIPGSVFLNLLSGALFGVMLGFPLVCLLTATGATCCFLLSQYFGKHHLVKNFPQKVEYMQKLVQENRDSLFFFLLFIRLFPMSPNWFLNMSSPVVNIPVHLFFLSVFIGLMPYNFICVETGCILSSITSVNDIFTTYTMLKMLAVAITAMLPGLVIKKFRKPALKVE